MVQPVLFLVGQTAVGKSQVAVEIAKQLGGEIVSADSMQVYRRMDIGTAKPSKQDRKKARHHLIDFLSPSKPFSVFEYRQKALKAIAGISKRKKLPIVVGGSGLYLHALLRGFTEVPGSRPAWRRQIENRINKRGLAVCYEELRQKAPEIAAKIQPNDKRRIVRGLEIVKGTRGNLKRNYKNSGSLADLGYTPVVIGLTCNREELYDRINQRVEDMFAKGLYVEAVKLWRGNVSLTASQAVGYKELGVLIRECRAKKREPSGEELAKTKELIQRNTRRFAKRQMTWFRRMDEIQWVENGSKSGVREKIKSILESAEKSRKMLGSDKSVIDVTSTR